MELSKQQYVVAELLSRGKTEKEIGSELYISPKTVNNHKTNIRRKWGARNTADIVRKFILNLDDPKNFFAWVIFFGIQINIMSPNPDIDWRTPQRPVKTSVRTVRTLRKK